jgi:hypothetical protein
MLKVQINVIWLNEHSHDCSALTKLANQTGSQDVEKDNETSPNLTDTDG